LRLHSAPGRAAAGGPADRLRPGIEEARVLSAPGAGRRNGSCGGPAMWTCPKCGTKVDPSFEVCWQCGTTVDGVEDPNFVPADAEPPPVSPLDLDMPDGDRPISEPLNPEAGELVEAYLAADVMQAKFVA